MSSPMPNNYVILQSAPVDLKSVSVQPLVTTGNRSFVLTTIVFSPLSITGVAAGDAAAGIGTGAPYTDFPGLASGPSSLGNVQVRACDEQNFNTYPVISASTTINMDVTAADSGATTYTMTVYLIGFYL